MTENSADQIPINDLFSKIDRSDRETLAASLQSTSFERGMLLQEEGKPIEKVVFPNSGLISLMAGMANGRNLHVAMLGRESALGISAGLAPHRLAPYRAVAQIDCLCQVIEAAPFLRALDESIPLRVLMARCYDAQVASAFQTVGCCALHQLSQRLSRWLLEACDGVGVDVVEVTHEMLSLSLGAQRSTITSIALDLERHALIRSGRGRIVVLNRHGLQARACECYGAGQRILPNYLDSIL